MNVAFRVDAGARIGTGHFMRCLGLADYLRSTGASIRFISHALPVHLAQMLAERGFVCASLGSSASDADVQETRLALAGSAWDWLVVDHYSLDARWESSLRGSANRIFVIDDLANRRHDCDLLLDQNLAAEEDHRYDDKIPRHCLVLLGPRYALLREEFRRTRSAVVPRTGAVTRVFISFGGSDETNWTAIAVDALAGARSDVGRVDVVIGDGHRDRAAVDAACRQYGFEYRVQPAEMAPLMGAADLAIGAGGVTMWERCCVGLPALTVATAANQEPGVREAARRGVVYSPAGGVATATSLARHIAALIENPDLREMLSRNGMDAVDGNGTARVGDAMGANPVCVRAATIDDAANLLEWRNHDSVRAFARRIDPIAPGDHYAWLRALLADPNRMLLIGERHGRALGVVRYDVRDDVAEVSIYRVPGIPDQSVGLELLHAAEAWLTVRRPHVSSFVAEVLGDNERSHRLFSKAGYRRRATIYEKSIYRP